MSEKAEVAFVLAGQGAYRPGMFAGVSEVQELLNTVDAIAAEFGRPTPSRYLLDGTAPSAKALSSTDPFSLQLAVFAASVGEYQRLTISSEPNLLVGHSVGELAALAVAGAFDLGDAARLVCHRSAALEVYAGEPGGMLSVDLPADRTAHLVGAIGDRSTVVAVHNAPYRTVIAGPLPALTTAAAIAEALGVGSLRLPAPYSFHSPGLAMAALEFTDAARGISRKPLRLPVYSPLLAAYVDDSEDLISLIARSMTTTIDFLSAVRDLHAHGLTGVVECGRSGLGGLITATVPDVVVAESIEEIGKSPNYLARTPQSVQDRPSSGTTPVLPVPVISTAPDNFESVTVEVDEIVDRLRQLYASVLQYPLEAVEPDADLEAELGLDSLKRAEMLGRVGVEFSLPETVNDGRFLAHTTLAELANMIAGTLTVEGAGR